MSGEYIKSSKACVYILGGEESTACLFDFDGEHVLDGGLEDKSVGFLSHVRDLAAVFISAPTRKNTGTASALVAKNKLVPVITNTKFLKDVKAESSGADFLKIQEASASILNLKPPVFNPKYEPYLLYHSIYKGHLSLYILAGDAKDGEAISKALSSGNEEAVEKAAAQHGTVGVLLWTPSEADKPVTRVLLQGTCSIQRVQQALDKATKALPFLNSPIVKSKDALHVRPEVKAAPAKPAVGKAPVRSNGTTTKPAAAPTRAAPAKPAVSRTAPTGRTTTTGTSSVRPSTSKSASSATRPTTAAPARTRPGTTTGTIAPPARKPIGTRPNAPMPKEAPIQKKIVGKVQGAAPSKSAASSAKSTPSAAPTAPKTITKPVAPAPVVEDVKPKENPIIPGVVVSDAKDDDIEFLGMYKGSNPKSSDTCDIIVIPPTPEPPRDEEVEKGVGEKERVATPEPEHELKEVKNEEANIYPTLPPSSDDVEPEIPPPIDAFEKPEPVPVAPEPKKDVPEPLDDPIAPPPEDPVDKDPIQPHHPEPSAPTIDGDDDVVIISTPHPPAPQPDEPAVDVASPFNPFVPVGPGGRSQADEIDIDGVAPGFEEPLIPQGARDDGLLPDCGEEVPRLMKISMDTDKEHSAEEPVQSDVTKLSDDLIKLSLNTTLADSDKSGISGVDEYVRKLSSQMVEDATTPFTSAFASSIVQTTTAEEISENGNVEKTTTFESLIDVGEPIPNGNGHVAESDHGNGNGHDEHETKEESVKHNLMQSRSSVIENGAPVHYEKTDPAIDGILDACAQESEKVDEKQHVTTNAGFEPIGMPERPAVTRAVRFARSYYFDVATIPRDDKLRTTVNKDEIEEFVTGIRSKNYILASKDISNDQLEGILTGKKTWGGVEEHPAKVIPTHSSPILLSFKQHNEPDFADINISFVSSVDKQRITISSDSVTSEYQLVKVPIQED